MIRHTGKDVIIFDPKSEEFFSISKINSDNQADDLIPQVSETEFNNNIDDFAEAEAPVFPEHMFEEKESKLENTEEDPYYIEPVE